jgi:hypothetical protein
LLLLFAIQAFDARLNRGERFRTIPNADALAPAAPANGRFRTRQEGREKSGLIEDRGPFTRSV